MRGKAEPFGSSNLPVPTNYSFSNQPFIQRIVFAADPRSTPTCHPPRADDTNRDCEGCEAKPSPSAVQICPSRPISAFPNQSSSRRSSWPTHEAPQPVIRAQRMTPIETARGARQSRALRQFKSARPDQFSFSNQSSQQRSSWPTHEAPQPVIRRGG